MKTLGLIALCTGLVVAGIGGAVYLRLLDPIVGWPGGRLAGTTALKPDDWSWTNEITVFQLETRPDDPCSVNIWGVAVGGDSYVSTQLEGTGWSRNVDDNGLVRLRAGENIYRLRAVRIGDGAERQRVLEAYIG